MRIIKESWYEATYEKDDMLGECILPFDDKSRMRNWIQCIKPKASKIKVVKIIHMTIYEYQKD